MKAQFYDWYVRPELSFLNGEYHGILCYKCAVREIGKKYLNEL